MKILEMCRMFYKDSSIGVIILLCRSFCFHYRCLVQKLIQTVLVRLALDSDDRLQDCASTQHLIATELEFQLYTHTLTFKHTDSTERMEN
jgi:hypothetical protein